MIKELLAGYEELREQGQLALPALKRVFVLVEHQALTAANVETEVPKLEAAQGWLRRQSHAYRTKPGQTTEAQDAGMPLSGEWVLSDTESKHLRQDGKGGWLLYRYRQFEALDEVQEAKKQGGGRGEIHDCLAEKTALLASDRGGNLAYHVYWGGEGANIRRLFARFSGFEPAPQQEGEQRS